MTIHATLDVMIDHHSGPPVENPEHVLRWACDVEQDFAGTYTGFMFKVCTGHAYPDECPEDCGRTFATYRARIVSADLAAPVSAR